MNSPTVLIRATEYALSKLTTTSYVRLSILIRPTDGTSLADMQLDKPETIADPQRRAQAVADRQKLSMALAERLGDDITTRRLAFALKSLCPELAKDGLVRYNHTVRPDDWLEADFDVYLEIEEVLDILAAASNWLTARQQQSALAKAEQLAEATEAALDKGFQPKQSKQSKPKPKSKRSHQ